MGKTSIAANLAVEIANLTKEKVALVDLNFQMGDITTFLDLNPAFDTSYVVNNLERIDETFLLSTLEKYKDTNKLDYEEIKKAGSAFSCKSVLIVSSYAVTNKNSKKRGIWEVLNISSAFDISYPYRLETSVVLLDTVNNLVMWSNNYSAKLGANDNIFAAKNYAQANAELEKIKLYSKTIVSSSASQNIMLRFFPKAVRPVENKVEDTNGGALKYERTLPQTRKDENKNEDIPYSGDMIYGI